MPGSLVTLPAIFSAVPDLTATYVRTLQPMPKMTYPWLCPPLTALPRGRQGQPDRRHFLPVRHGGPHCRWCRRMRTCLRCRIGQHHLGRERPNASVGRRRLINESVGRQYERRVTVRGGARRCEYMQNGEHGKAAMKMHTGPTFPLSLALAGRLVPLPPSPDFVTLQLCAAPRVTCDSAYRIHVSSLV
jgi:hypothetical protein